MKKFLCLVLVLILAMSVFSACSSETAVPDDKPIKAEEGKSGATPPPAASGGEATPAEGESTSGEDATVSGGATPAVYLATDATDNDVKISYHLDGCTATKGLTVQEIDWDMVKTLGFRQCQQCKPPKYEGYIE